MTRCDKITRSLVTLVAFIPFFAFKELGRVLGEGKIRTSFSEGKSGGHLTPLSAEGIPEMVEEV